MLYTLPSTRVKLTTTVVIGTDSLGICKSNHHTITAMTVELRTFVLVHLAIVLSVLLRLRILITTLIFLCSSCLFVIFCLLAIVLSVLRMYGAVMAVIVWWLDLQIPNESVPITTVVVSLTLVEGKVYNKRRRTDNTMAK
jgi:hypothetical protein